MLTQIRLAATASIIAGVWVAALGSGPAGVAMILTGLITIAATQTIDP